jgi:hypothetical protein
MGMKWISFQFQLFQVFQASLFFPHETGRNFKQEATEKNSVFAADVT